VKQEWKTEAKEEGLSLSRYLHNLIQESRVMWQQGRLKLGDRRRVEERQQEVDELKTKLENQRQTRSNPNMGSSLIQPQTLDELVTSEFKPSDRILKELIGDEEFPDHRIYNKLRQFEDDGRIAVDRSGRLNEYRRISS